MLFFTGIHQPAWASRITRPFISINRLRGRRSGFEVGEWILDSGAFTELRDYGAWLGTNCGQSFLYEVARKGGIPDMLRK